MEKIFVIGTIRYYSDHMDVSVGDNYFNTEKDAKAWLEKKYGDWLDIDHLYIYYGGLNRFRICNERGIAFFIKPLVAA